MSIQIEQISVEDLIPYDFNPRINAPAIAAVKKSILDFGFLVPIIADTNNVIVAGHTRHAALLELMEEYPDRDFGVAPTIIADHLTEEQLRAFRLIDNKTAELADWDFGLLANELNALSESGIPFTEFGWTQEELDCLHEVVAPDCLTEEPDVATTTADSTPGEVTLRITFGELGFVVRRADYDEWLNNMMAEHNYSPAEVINEVADRMGLLEAKLAREIMPETDEYQSDDDGEVSVTTD